MINPAQCYVSDLGKTYKIPQPENAVIVMCMLQSMLPEEKVTVGIHHIVCHSKMERLFCLNCAIRMEQLIQHTILPSHKLTCKFDFLYR